jgi:hypothetical protein
MKKPNLTIQTGYQRANGDGQTKPIEITARPIEAAPTDYVSKMMTQAFEDNAAFLPGERWVRVYAIDGGLYYERVSESEVVL